MSADFDAQGLALRALAGVNTLAKGAAYPAGTTDFSTWSQVATACRMADTLSGSNKGYVSRSAHTARVAITQLAIVLPNWWWDRGASKLELTTAGPVQFRASIEYPENTLIPVTFDGQARPLVSENGAIVSDLIPVSIPAGARFAVRFWAFYAGSGNTPFSNYANDLFGNGPFREVSQFGTGAVTDYSQQLMTGAPALWSDGATQQAYQPRPLAIIAPVAHAGVACIGDSITGGVGDTPDASGDMGITGRIVGPTNGYINLGSSGDSLYVFRTSYRKRLSLLPYTRNAICAYGTNDIGNGRTLAQLQADMIWLWSLLKSGYAQKRVLQTTITPQTTSSDSWQTIANQSAKANFSTAGNGTREMLNDWLRDGAPMLSGVAAAAGASATGTARVGNGAHPLDGVIDVADQVESARNSGKWKVDGTANKWTADGVHPTQYGYQTASAALAAGLAGQLTA